MSAQDSIETLKHLRKVFTAAAVDADDPKAREEARSRRDAIDAAIAALRVVPEWRPISSAPKDGSWVNLLSGEGQDVGAWRDTRYCMIGAPQGSYGPGWIDQHNCLPISGEFEPTHWQPLPPPPAGEKE